MKSYKELIVWQRSIDLVTLIYQETLVFPKEELYVLVSQMRRSVISIPSNISEGYARRTTKEYINFIQIAFGSAAELETKLIIANKLGYLSNEKHMEIESKLTEILKMLNGLLVKLKSKTSR
jgi:four helix bundle protein